jgi:hypothetical protein
MFAPSRSEPDAYELNVVNNTVENKIVVKEHPKDPSLSMSNSVAAATVSMYMRTTILMNRIKHDWNLRPVFDLRYRRQMKELSMKYNTLQRQIRMIGGAGVPGGRCGVNRLSGRAGLGLGECLVISLCVFRSGSSFCVHFLIVSSHCPMFATCCILTSHHLHAGNQTKTTQRQIRAHGAYAAYAAEPTARSHLPAVP